MQIVKSVAAMQRLAQKWRRDGTRVGLVPTMGHLHDGHLSLVRAARRCVGKNGKVVVSIYVNPTQFGPNEDFSKYPRNLKRDLKLCRSKGVDVVFAPGDKEMYRVGSSRRDDRTARRAGARRTSVHTKFPELNRLIAGAKQAHALGLKVNAGHGLNYENLPMLFRVPHLVELNIGHSIVSRAVIVGLKTAVKEMLAVMKKYRP